MQLRSEENVKMDCTFHIIAITYREREKTGEKKNVYQPETIKSGNCLNSYIERNMTLSRQNAQIPIWFVFFSSRNCSEPKSNSHCRSAICSRCDIRNVWNVTVFFSFCICIPKHSQSEPNTKCQAIPAPMQGRQRWKGGGKQTSGHTVKSDNLMKLHQVDWMDEIEFQIIMVLSTNQSESFEKLSTGLFSSQQNIHIYVYWSLFFSLVQSTQSWKNTNNFANIAFAESNHNHFHASHIVSCRDNLFKLIPFWKLVSMVGYLNRNKIICVYVCARVCLRV